MITSQEGIALMKNIAEKRNELRAPVDKELDELAEKMIALSDPEIACRRVHTAEYRNVGALGVRRTNHCCSV